MRRFDRVLLLIASLLVLMPAATYAQASIAGIVRDSSGAVLPGVTVEAASDVLIEKVRVGTTDGTGRYRIVSLPPGTYVVTDEVRDPQSARAVSKPVSFRVQ